MFTQRISKSNNCGGGSKDLRKGKKESFVNGSLAIKSHASRMKVLTSGNFKDEEIELSQKTASTIHSNNLMKGQDVEKLMT